MEGLAIRASRPSIFCSLPGLGGDSQRRPPSEGFLRLPASSNAVDDPKLVMNSASFHPISAVNVSAQASLTADFPISETKERLKGEEKAENIVWHESSICRCDRQQLLQQKGCVIWITGLSGSGKSTVACALSKALFERGKLSYTLDGDNVRHGLNRDLTFKAEDRTENIRRIGEVAKLFADVGVICIASLISPYRRDRDACRSLLPEGDFVEVFMDVPLHVCESRDPKGLYKLARAGKIKGFTGIDDPYEAPLNCEVVLKHTGDDLSCSPRQMAENIISYLQNKGYLES
uniref:Adenylyl-sulfate kinase n=1 Tax=Leavenworthia alabamica TaxID=310722 RepID=A0A2Z4HJZ2_LEAAL|nr:adenylyl-sulfate kinase 2 [Leavenworthia alabamica]